MRKALRLLVLLAIGADFVALYLGVAEARSPVVAAGGLAAMAVTSVVAILAYRTLTRGVGLYGKDVGSQEA